MKTLKFCGGPRDGHIWKALKASDRIVFPSQPEASPIMEWEPAAMNPPSYELHYYNLVCDLGKEALYAYDSSHIRTTPYQLTVVHLAHEIDGEKALYNGNDLVLYGDYYHDKIDHLINGSITTLHKMGIPIKVSHLYVSKYYYIPGDHTVPFTLSMLKATFPTSETL